MSPIFHYVSYFIKYTYHTIRAWERLFEYIMKWRNSAKGKRLDTNTEHMHQTRRELINRWI